MTRPILITLALCALTAALSAGMLHAQSSTEAERPPYRIDLHPGWNLISFPGDPVDASLESVIGDAQVDVILGYQDDDWLAAVRKTDGGWRTTSGFTTLSGGWGYWLHTPVPGIIEVVLSPVGTSPPALEIPTRGCNSPTSGWNLVGVWDAEQRPPDTEVDADNYFGRTNWRVAYGFLGDEYRWTKQVPTFDRTVKVAAGYWVWESRICGLVP